MLSLASKFTRSGAASLAGVEEAFTSSFLVFFNFTAILLYRPERMYYDKTDGSGAITAKALTFISG